MSAEIYSASGNDASLQGTTVGASKPLHRFLKGQPKIVGIVVLVLGSSFFIVSIACMSNTVQYIWTVIPPGLLLGVLFSVSGILYILAEHNPTKKMITASLALSIVTILVVCWTIIHIVPRIIHGHYYRHYDYYDDNTTETEEATWTSYYAAMEISFEAVYLFYSFVGIITFITMSTLAGIAVRSTKSQAIVVMTAVPTEAPVE
ncbi:hypothetical protein L3Q82_008915 [Scortum barcoo]|uniref:Uncharacterized protein n=1 Tax=Scortum barcoo TaxID=214431 RepID=A0ACB8XCU2_9TELE|nr:hypothetical protein L3Q82_008915 [Scortum barcoo]